jgi:hypothetical protein
MAKKRFKPKKAGTALEAKTFIGKKGNAYTVFKTPGGSYHVLVETEAKAAARDSGAKGKKKTTRQLWDSIWNQ